MAAFVSSVLAAGVLAVQAPTADATVAPPSAVEVVASTGNTAATWLAPQPSVAFDAPRDRGVVVTVDTGHLGAPVDGVGAAISESTAHLLLALPAEQRTALLRTLFAPGGRFGFSVVRVPLGASDFSLSHTPTTGTYQDTPDPATVSLERAADVLTVLRELRTIRPDLVVHAAPWSPPAWAKTTGSLYGGGLRDDAIPAYGDYLVRVVDAYAAAGAPIDRLALHNEVRHAPHDYPGARIPHPQLAALGERVRPALTARGVELVALDHNAEDVPHAISLLDRVASGTVDAVALHCYAGDLGLADALHDVHPGTPVEVTECTSGRWSTDTNANLRWDARELLVAGGRLGARTVVKWNLALDPSGGPHLGGCGTCTGVVTLDPVTGGHRLEHDAYALGHLGAGLTPGARYAASTSSPSHGLSTIATSDGTRHQVVLVHDAGVARTVTLRWGARRAVVEVAPWSVTTLRWSGLQQDGAGVGQVGGLVGREVRAAAVLTWPVVPGASGYRVQRAATTKGPWTDVATVDATPTPRWHDTTRGRGTDAVYRVAAVRGTTVGSWSSAVAVALPTSRRVGTDIQAEAFDRQLGVTLGRCGDGCLAVGALAAGRHVAFDRVELQGAAVVRLAVATDAPARVRLATGAGRELAVVSLPATGGRITSVSVPIAATPGVTTVVVEGVEGTTRLDRLTFATR